MPGGLGLWIRAFVVLLSLLVRDLTASLAVVRSVDLGVLALFILTRSLCLRHVWSISPAARSANVERARRAHRRAALENGYFAGFAGPRPICTLLTVKSPGWSTITNDSESLAMRNVGFAEAKAAQLE